MPNILQKVKFMRDWSESGKIMQNHENAAPNEPSNGRIVPRRANPKFLRDSMQIPHLSRRFGIDSFFRARDSKITAEDKLWIGLCVKRIRP